MARLPEETAATAARELVEYASDPEAVRELTSYLRYYNADRRHSSLGYVSQPSTNVN